MEQPTRQRKTSFVWMGLALLLLTGTIAILFIIHLIKNPEDVHPFIIVLILLFLGVPVVTITYGVRGVRVRPVAEKQRIVKRIYSMRNRLGSLKMYTRLCGVGLFGLLFLGMTVLLIWWVITAYGWEIWLWAVPLITGASGWVTFSIFLWARGYGKDIREGCTKLVGSVSRKWEEEKIERTPYGGGVSTEYSIDIKGVSFQVSKKIYDWLMEGDEVCVSYWPHTKTVSRIDKVMG